MSSSFAPAAKAADILADALRHRILAGEWDEGETLPTERELVEQSGLSRASVREALRILDGDGLISTRAGRGGGSSVRHPTHEAIGRSVRLFIRGQRSGFHSLLQARETIEPAVSRLAALNRTAEDLSQLDAIQARMVAGRQNREIFLRANVDWHVAVAQASHNPLLLAFMSAISHEILTWTSAETYDTGAIIEATIVAHAAIALAIRKQDADAASRRMSRHVEAYGGVARDAMQVRQKTK